MQGRPKGSEVSRYDTLKQVEKSLGRKPEALQNAPELRSEHRNAWDVFNRLGECSYQEIDAYVRITGDELSGWEIEAIMRLNLYRGIEEKQWPPKSDN